MSFSQDLSDTFSQINAAGVASLENVSVTINNDGSIVGQGITPSQQALSVSGGHLDSILSAFGGIPGEIQGGAANKLTGKTKAIMKKAHEKATKLDNHLREKLEKIHHIVAHLSSLSSLLEAGINSGDHSEQSVKAMRTLSAWISEWLETLQNILEKDFGLHYKNLAQVLHNNAKFVDAMKKLKNGGLDLPKAAGVASLTFSNVNDLGKVGGAIQNAFQSLNSKQEYYINGAMDKVRDLANGGEVPHIVQSFKSFAEAEGYTGGFDNTVSGGVNLSTSLAERLVKSREEIKVQINKFLNSFGADLNHIVDGVNALCTHLGKDVPYSDNVLQFITTVSRLNEYLHGAKMKGKIYQHLLEINTDTIDSKEIKDRFISNLKLVAEKALELGSTSATKMIASACLSAVESIGKHSDMLKSFRDETRKNGGTLTEVMNDLFSTDASKIEITALTNPLTNLQIAIKKLQFFKNVAIFRSNLSHTNKELVEYSKDYEKSVGQSIGQAIDRINTEYQEIIRQIDDTKVGMGLEIEMYNDSIPVEKKINKEKLKMMYKWQCEARIGLYKTVEAIDLYLLHFTDNVTKNPDAVADLHKLLSATKIIAKWYDKEVGSSLIRIFESFADEVLDVDRPDVDSDRFLEDYRRPGFDEFADLSNKVGGDRAMKIYERCRRAVQGVVVLKNIISYFITLGEKYGNMRQEKSIYMAPSNIYKNLVNYIWVSSLDINTTGSEILTENNEIKRMLTYEDTKVKVAQISETDPVTMGINFNRHSINKLRILKCHSEFIRFQDMFAGTDDMDFSRLHQLVSGIFARLGKTKYIYEMIIFGVFDLVQLTKQQLGELYDYINVVFSQAARKRLAVGRIDIGIRDGIMDSRQAFMDGVWAMTPEDKNSVIIEVEGFVDGRGVTYRLISLPTFMMKNQLADNLDISSMQAPFNNYSGFLAGFLQGVNGNEQAAPLVYAKRINSVLHYIIMKMLNNLASEQSSSVFAIDDNYFILTLKAITGKVLTVAGISALFKKPNAYQSMINANKTRIIMGGADSLTSDPEIIEDAIELYVRLPLLVEFYRSIFDNGNKEYKKQSAMDLMDNEQISFVPEIGNVWSNLIINIFDKSRFIDEGLYTQENMRKIVSEVNGIYKHYKSKYPAETIVRDICQELAFEINRRYGIVKRQELMNYYKVMNATKRANLSLEEIHYNSNNDYNILNEEIEFEEKSPSEAFLQVKKAFSEKNTPTETKLNKLTDYKILKDFRARIEDNIMGFDLNANELNNVSMIERIRMLKQNVRTASTQEDKYGEIIKAIEESDSISQTASDIMICFHELVITPLRTVDHIYTILEAFYTLLLKTIQVIPDNPIFQTKIGPDRTLAELIQALQPVNVQGLQYSANLEEMTLFNVLSHFTANHGDLIKLSVTNTGRITLDLSEMQTVCEHLISNAKFMLDKFTGIIPNQYIELFSNPDQRGSAYWLEQNVLNKFFNKLNLSDKERNQAPCVEDIYKITPFISKQLFENNINVDKVLNQLIICSTREVKPFNGNNIMPIIKDAFMKYDTASRSFVAGGGFLLSDKLFNPSNTASLLTGENTQQGIIQEFNTLIAHYLNDLYDPLTRKMYSKLFNKFSNIAYQDAMTGNAYPDFGTAETLAGGNLTNIPMPASHFTLSATLAYVMHSMTHRIHPLNNINFHEITSINQVSEHTLERYRACLPMYLRLFETFLVRCKLLRRLMTKVNMTATGFAPEVNFDLVSSAGENRGVSFISYGSTFRLIDRLNQTDARDGIILCLDDMINGITTLMDDASTVHKELMVHDKNVPMFGDTRLGFQRSFILMNKDIPFSPLSTLMAYNGGLSPVSTQGNTNNFKFLYALQPLLIDGFQLSLSKIPYMKKILSDFNGYNTKSNVIPEDKISSLLKHIGRAYNFIYDWKIFNGDILCNARYQRFTNIDTSTAAFQESTQGDGSEIINMLEGTVTLDSKIRISKFVSSIIPAPAPAAAAPVNGNPRSKKIVVNIIDLGIMPINIHSLMREIPLTNLYNYAISFDQYVNALDQQIAEPIRFALVNPYSLDVRHTGNPTGQFNVNSIISSNDPALRFLNDILKPTIVDKFTTNANGIFEPENIVIRDILPAAHRINSKIFRNLTFLTLLQYLIKIKVKEELEFINTRVVSDVAAVSDVITNAAAVNEDLFQF